MRRIPVLLAVVALASVASVGLTPVASVAGDVITVPLNSLNDTGDPFPKGWAMLNIPRGEVTILAILPANTTVPGPSDPAVAPARAVFEGWIADLAPPHRCRIPDLTAEVEPAVAGIFEATDDVPDGTVEVDICGSRRSSETGFRNFPGLINRTFQHTYFPVSQGVLTPVGRRLGEWQLYMVRHKTNMGLRPYDVVGITVEPPGTGAPLRDYDPRPSPVVILAGRIPLPNAENPSGENEGPGTRPPRTNRGPIQVR